MSSPGDSCIHSSDSTLGAGVTRHYCLVHIVPDKPKLNAENILQTKLVFVSAWSAEEDNELCVVAGMFNACIK